MNDPAKRRWTEKKDVHTDSERAVGEIIGNSMVAVAECI